jgi:hypothetical protein
MSNNISKILHSTTDGMLFRLGSNGLLYQATFESGFVVGWTVVPDCSVTPLLKPPPYYPAPPPQNSAPCPAPVMPMYRNEPMKAE